MHEIFCRELLYGGLLRLIQILIVSLNVLLDITTMSNGATAGSNRKVITTINKTVNLLSPMFSTRKVILQTRETKCSADSAHVVVLFGWKSLTIIYVTMSLDC